MNRRFLIKIHLYCGLFTVFYLVAFGFSSIVLNHKINLDNTVVTQNWATTTEIDPAGKENKELAEIIKNELGLMGWTPFWLYKRDSSHFRFTVTHPGRNYHLNLNLLQGTLQIEEAPKGFLSVLNSIHFLNGHIPNAPLLLRSWAVYQWLALLTMLVSLFLGLWLWIRYHYRTWEGVVFGGVFVITLFVMVLI